MRHIDQHTNFFRFQDFFEALQLLFYFLQRRRIAFLRYGTQYAIFIKPIDRSWSINNFCVWGYFHTFCYLIGGGSFTMLSQKSSMERITLMNWSKSTGLVM